MNKILYLEVCKKFKKNKNVKIIKGRVPDIMEDTIPDQIAFAHIDRNHWVPETAALEMILPKIYNHPILGEIYQKNNYNIVLKM